MNLAERLLKIDKGEFNKERTKQVKSEQLSILIGEPAKIILKELNPQEVLDITSAMIDSEGNPEIKKTFNTNAILTAAAVIEPNLKDDALLKYLGVATPAEAAKKLFKGEVNRIAEIINKMAGFDPNRKEDTDEEIKN